MRNSADLPEVFGKNRYTIEELFEFDIDTLCNLATAKVDPSQLGPLSERERFRCVSERASCVVAVQFY